MEFFQEASTAAVEAYNFLPNLVCNGILMPVVQCLSKIALSHYLIGIISDLDPCRQDLLIPKLINEGVEGLIAGISVRAGTPIKPMLAK